MVLVQTYIFDKDNFLIMPGIFSLSLFLSMVILHGMVGLDANHKLIKSLLKVTRSYIVISTIFDYVLIDQGCIYQGTVGHKIMRLVWRDWIDLKITGGGFLNREYLCLTLWAVGMGWVCNETPCYWFYYLTISNIAVYLFTIMEYYSEIRKNALTKSIWVWSISYIFILNSNIICSVWQHDNEVMCVTLRH